MKKTIVDYRQGLNVRLIEAIIAQGHAVASSTGVVLPADQLEVCSRAAIAIAEKEPSLRKKYLFGLIRTKGRRRIIATIWFDNEPRKARPKRWVVETSGREYLDETVRLVENLAREFEANVKIVIQSDDASYEALPSDYDM